MDTRKGRNTKIIVSCGFFCALALILSYVEYLLPIDLGVPGIKLGLPNVVTLFLMYRKTKKEALIVLVLRLCLSSLLFGSLVSLLYSAAGAALSFLAMLLFQKIRIFSSRSISILGGVFHNIGQIAIASLVMRTEGIFTYLPVLCLSGTIAGAVIGFIGYLLIQKIPLHFTN